MEQACCVFASMLRHVLGQTNVSDDQRAQTSQGSPARVLLADEVTFLRDYLALEKQFMNERLRVDSRDRRRRAG